MLFLKANPLIEDGGGYRAVDYVDPISEIHKILKNWMARAEKPLLFEFGDVDAAMKT